MKRHGLHWYAVHTKAQMERAVFQQLTGAGFWAFYPYQHVKRWRRIPGHGQRREDVALPYMPRYAFVWATRKDIGALNQVPGVSTIVSVNGEPLRIPGKVMRALIDASAIQRDDNGRPIGSLMGAVDRTKRVRSFKAKVGDIIHFNRDTVFADFAARVSSLADLDATGQIKVWLQMLGSEREISVPIEVIATAA